MEVKLSSLIAPAFYRLHHTVREGRHTHYWLKGGRGSTKSSFISVQLILSIMEDAGKGEATHALVLRRYSNTLRESVFEQLLWAVNALGAGRLWRAGVSPMKLVYTPSGQSVIFRGVDDAAKLKSIKVNSGYIKYLWVEEANEFEGPEKLRGVLQSVIRGGSRFCCFYSFNPPKSAGNWVNQYVRLERPGTFIHHSDYRTVPREWLGEQFITEAEHLREVKPEAYRHEYLGEVTGTGGEVFENVTLRRITDGEREEFDNIRHGIDWGYAADPFAYNGCHYDKTRRRLYIFSEIHKMRLSNRAAAGLVRKKAGGGLITCDSAEPKSIDEMKSYGLRVRGAKKGPDSVEYGVKWLQDLEEIIIDPQSCPETAREFCGYELDRDREGNFKEGYPDRDNHHIDAVRYACEGDMRRPGTAGRHAREADAEEELAMFRV